MSQFDAATARQNLSKKDWNADDDDAAAPVTSAVAAAGAPSDVPPATPETKTAEAVVSD
jgi:hypothetical protein